MVDDLFERTFEVARPFRYLKPGERWVAVTREKIDGLNVVSAVVGEGRNGLIDRLREDGLRGRDVEVRGARGNDFMEHWPKDKFI